MQNKINLDTHNEVIPVSEPWHRGSGFTWMLLALAGVVFFLTGAVAKSESISYTMQGNQFDRTSSTGNAGTFNDGATQFGMWMDGDNTSQGNVIWKTFRTGSSTGSSARDLQVGDSFTIKINTRGAYYGSIGVSLNDGNDFASDTFSNRLDNSRLAIIQNGGNFGSGGGRGSWFADGSGTSSFNITPNSTTQDYDLTFKITSGNTANVRVQGNGSDLTINDVALDGTSGANIDSFSVWLSDDRSLAWNDSGGGRGNVILKSASVANTGTVELGYALASGSKDISGVISDGLAAGSTTTTSANSVYVGGDAGSQVNLSGNNTYTGTTTVNANATAEVQHANALGSTAGGTTVTSGGALKLYDASGISYATEAITLNGVGVNGNGGALQSVGGNNTWNGVITAGSNTRIAATSGSLNVAGGISGGSNVLYVGTEGGGITISSAISGSGAAQDETDTSLFKDGSGTLTLTGNNNYSGDTRITAGTLTVNSGGNLGNGNSDVFISSGATLNVNTSLTVDSVRETGNSNGGVIALGNGATLTIDGASKGTLYQNSISGSGHLTMAGSGTTSLALYGSQTYTGDTTVSGGKISTGVALSTAGVTVSGGVFETSAANILGNSASVNISGTGDYSLGGDDTVGALTISGGQLSGSSTLTAATYALQGGTVGANLGAGAATASTGTTALNGNLTGSLEATGGTVNAAGTIGGSVTVSGGTVNLSAADRIANGAAVSVSSGTLGMGANNDTVGSFSISGGTLGGTGKLTATNYGLSGGAVNANLGAGTVNANSGTTALNGTVDATTINVGGGTVNLGSGGRLAAGATANVSSGTLSTGGNETITRLNATGGIVNLTDDTLTVTGTGGNASSIGAGAEMVGGTIAIGTASANSGRMTINSLDADNTSALSIASGGTLTGSFRTSGALSVDGVFAPGNSTGISYVGASTFLGGGRYEWEVDTFGPGAAVGTNWDFLDISGALTISATSGDKFWIDIISLLASNDQTGEASGFNLTSNYSFAIATAAGGISGFNAGAFGINSEGFLNSVGAGDPLYVSAGSWSVSQQGNSLMLNYSGATAIPEPSSAALVLVGLGAALLNRRRRG